MSYRERLKFGTWRFPNMQLYPDELYHNMIVSGPNANHFERAVKTIRPETMFVTSINDGVQIVKTDDTKKICLWSDLVSNTIASVDGYYFTMTPDIGPSPNLRWMCTTNPEVNSLSESIGRKVASYLYDIGEQPKQTSIMGAVKFIDWSEFIVIYNEDWMNLVKDEDSDETCWVPSEYGVPFKPSQRRVMEFHREIKQAFRILVPTVLPSESDVESPREISDGWLGLRQLLYDLCIENSIPRRDSNLVSWNLVPPEANMRRTDLLSHMIENDIITNLKQVTFNERIRTRTRQLSNSDIGRAVEKFAHRTLSGARGWYLGGSSGRGHCDIASWPSCDVSDVSDGGGFYALNVKFSNEPHVNRVYEVTPENEVVKSGGLAWVLMVMPKSLRMILFPLDGSETQHLNSNKGINTTPENLASDIERLIEKND